MKSIFTYLLFLITTFSITYAQWQQEWTSPSVSSLYYSGWLAFTEVNDEWDYKFYTIDETTIRIMNGAYSSTPLYQYTFTSAEIFAEYQIYSLGVDLTGDNNVEFYVISYYGSAEPYRQSFKIFDITTGQVIFEKNNSSFYYSYPVVWDADDDGLLECSFSVYDYPNFVNYNYEIYNTNVSTSVERKEPVRLGFELKQNYPNPFNPSTTIEFDMLKESKVDLNIYDALGRRVVNLINQNLIPGNHKVKFNGSDLSSGTYFYQLKTDDRVYTKKMSLVK